ncbi:MAG TPA: hypothetical protein VH479_03405 [Acidimicrobiales bacterium]|jgi:hypothetical protein
MQIRLARRVLLVSAVVAALALSSGRVPIAGLARVDAGAGGHASDLLSQANVPDAKPVAARLDQRDPAGERTLQLRLTLVAIVAALVLVPGVVRWPGRGTEPGGRVARYANPPFCGRAPPAGLALRLT